MVKLVFWLTTYQFSLSFAQLTVPVNLPTTWSSEGCWVDVPGRTIGAAGYADAINMTIESCINYCGTRSFAYAGVEYSIECYCGNTLAPVAAQAAATECSMACSGDTTQLVSTQSERTSPFIPFHLVLGVLR